jgi:hypothetical protein
MPDTQLAQQIMHLDARQRVKRTERLIRQEQVGIPDQRTGEGGALRFTAGQLVWPGSFSAGQTHFDERGPASIRYIVTSRAQHHIVENPAPRQQTRVLKNDRDPVWRLQLTRACDVMVQVGDGAQQGGFSGAATPEQCNELPSLDVQAHPMQHRTLTKTSGQIGHANGGPR